MKTFQRVSIFVAVLVACTAVPSSAWAEDSVDLAYRRELTQKNDLALLAEIALRSANASAVCEFSALRLTASAVGSGVVIGVCSVLTFGVDGLGCVSNFSQDGLGASIRQAVIEEMWGRTQALGSRLFESKDSACYLAWSKFDRAMAERDRREKVRDAARAVAASENPVSTRARKTLDGVVDGVDSRPAPATRRGVGVIN